MPTVSLVYHPLSSCCHKVMIAADVLGVPLQLQLYNPGNAAERAAHAALWPLGKMPLLIDSGETHEPGEPPCTIPETSIIVEHLQLHHAKSGQRLIPHEPEAALQVRLWDRLFDFYVMTPMQALTADRLRPESERDAIAVAQARQLLATAYALVDRQLQGRSWVCGERFTLADCAAAPALFYAVAYLPPPAALSHLHAYFERLMAHPAVARTVDQARPFLQYFPGRAGLARRFYDPAA